MKLFYRLLYSTFLLTILLFGLAGCSAAADPEIESGEFPFRVVYQYQGEVHTIEDVVMVEYWGTGHISMNIVSPRVWSDQLAERAHYWQNFNNYVGTPRELIVTQMLYPHESKVSRGRTNHWADIWIDYGRGGYYMGDPNYASAGPRIVLAESYDSLLFDNNIDHIELSFEQAEEIFGIKIIEWNFSEPIENNFMHRTLH